MAFNIHFYTGPTPLIWPRYLHVPEPEVADALLSDHVKLGPNVGVLQLGQELARLADQVDVEGSAKATVAGHQNDGGPPNAIGLPEDRLRPAGTRVRRKACRTRVWARRSFEVATISMVRVILRVLWTERIRRPMSLAFAIDPSPISFGFPAAQTAASAVGSTADVRNSLL